MGTPSRRRQRVDFKLLRTCIPDSDDVEAAEAALIAMSKPRGPAAEPAEPAPEDKPRSADRVAKAWSAFLKRVEDGHGWRVRKELGAETVLDPVYPDRHVQQRFLEACETLDSHLTVTYHGTKARNIDSIKQRGLLVPGHGGVKVVNGSAHGVGVYTAQIGSASLSRGFCDSDTLFVCAVCDTSEPLPEQDPSSYVAFKPSMTHVQTCFPRLFTFQGKTFGAHKLTQESAEVRHVGNAVVVFEERCVVPVFTARIPAKEPQGAEDQPEKVEPWEAGPQQIGRRRLVVPEAGKELIRFGTLASGRSGQTVWLPPLPKPDVTSHERAVQRRRYCRMWQCRRVADRQTKRDRLGHF